MITRIYYEVTEGNGHSDGVRYMHPVLSEFAYGVDMEGRKRVARWCAEDYSRRLNGVAAWPMTITLYRESSNNAVGTFTIEEASKT